MVSVRFSNDAVDTSILAEKITMPFSGLVAPNRFMKAPLSEGIASWDQHDISKRGVPTKELITLYERWGEGEIGVIITGNLMVDPEHMEIPGNMILSGNHDGRVEAFRELATASKKHGSLVVAQINHPGRQVRKIIQPNPVSASDVQLVKAILPYAFAKPTPLTSQGIKEIVDKFARTSELLYEAGFDGVQIHGAHGYLISQFLSPSTNKRTDNYGGSLENRSRIIFEIIAEVRRRVPDKKFSISIKLNSVEFQDGAFDTEDCKELCKKLEQAEVDFVELSGGNYEEFGFEHKSERTKQRESFFLDFSDSIRPSLTKTKVYVTGGFRTSSAMVSAIQGNSCDGIGLGRPICDEPTLCAKLLAKGSNVHSARKPINLGGQAPEVWVASLQLVQVSQDLEPIDISDEKRRVDIIAAMTEDARVEAENEKCGRLAPRRRMIPGWNVPYSASKGSRAQVGA